MKKIDRYIVKNYLKAVFLSLFGFLNIYVVARLFKIIKYITTGRMTLSDAFLYLLTDLAAAIVDMMPLAVLLGSLITISKMAKSLEVIALKTSGVSFSRIVRGPIILSFVLALFTYWFNDNVVPVAKKRARTLKSGEIEKTSKSKKNLFFKGQGPYIYYAEEVNGQKESMVNVEVVKLSEDMSQIIEVITAKNASYVETGWEFYDGVVNKIKEGQEQEFSTYKAPYLQEKVEDFLVDEVRAEELRIKEMRQAANFVGSVGGNSMEILTALYKKLSYPFACFVVSFLGLSLGSRYVRGGSAISITLSLVLGYSYYVVQASLEAMSQGGMIPPIIGAWVPNIIFFCFGIMSMKRAEY